MSLLSSAQGVKRTNGAHRWVPSGNSGVTGKSLEDGGGEGRWCKICRVRRN